MFNNLGSDEEVLTDEIAMGKFDTEEGTAARRMYPCPVAHVIFSQFV